MFSCIFSWHSLVAYITVISAKGADSWCEGVATALSVWREFLGGMDSILFRGSTAFSLSLLVSSSSLPLNCKAGTHTHARISVTLRYYCNVLKSAIQIKFIIRLLLLLHERFPLLAFCCDPLLSLRLT